MNGPVSARLTAGHDLQDLARTGLVRLVARGGGTEVELTDQTLWQAAESLAPGAGGRTAELTGRAVVAGYVADWWADERVETPRSDGGGELRLD